MAGKRHGLRSSGFICHVLLGVDSVNEISKKEESCVMKLETRVNE